jgi:5-methylcytosine-specific restriction endonuclease McrA
MTRTKAQRGRSNQNDRGSAAQRRARKQAVLNRDGTGTWALCVTCPTVVDLDTMTLDRIVPGMCGGTYALDNVQPQCERCSRRQGAYLTLYVRGRITLDALRAAVGPLLVLDAAA